MSIEHRTTIHDFVHAADGTALHGTSRSACPGALSGSHIECSVDTAHSAGDGRCAVSGELGARRLYCTLRVVGIIGTCSTGLNS
eukprot:1256291-Prymnesium_polylepis.1